jgi:hypothetical protein
VRTSGSDIERKARFVGHCAAVAIDCPSMHGVNGEGLQNEQLSWPVGGCHDRFTYTHRTGRGVSRVSDEARLTAQLSVSELRWREWNRR